MKTKILGSLLLALLFTGCGSSNNNPTGAGTPVAGVGNGLAYNGATGCVPINQPVNYYGQNVYADWANVYAGQIPGGQSIGTMSVGFGQMMPQGYNPSATYSRQGVDGNITMSFMSAGNYNGAQPYSGYYPGSAVNPYNTGLYTSANFGAYTGNVVGMNGFNSSLYTNPGTSPGYLNIQGTIAISAQTQQDILYRFGGQSTYNPGAIPGVTGNLPCVSRVAINAGKYDRYNIIYGAHIYLYLNNSSNGYVLYF